MKIRVILVIRSICQVWRVIHRVKNAAMKHGIMIPTTALLLFKAKVFYDIILIYFYFYRLSSNAFLMFRDDVEIGEIFPFLSSSMLNREKN